MKKNHHISQSTLFFTLRSMIVIALLTAAEAEQFMPKRFLAGSDHWNPIAEAARLP